MNQRALARVLSQTFDLPQRTATRLLHVLTDTLADSLRRSDPVTFHHFGVFRRTHRAAKKVRHPTTGKIITVPAHATVSFRPAPALEQMFNSPTKMRVDRRP